MKEKTLSSKHVYSCSFMNLYEDQVELPNKKTSNRVWVDHPGAACVLPITKEGLIILTRQFRYPIRKESLEIPAGKKDSITESGFDCIKRELEEETSFQSTKIEYIMSFYNCLGYSNEIIEFYIARDCFKVDNPLPQDEDEFIEVELYTLDEVVDLIKNHVIQDVKTILAIHHYRLELSQ